MSKRRLISAIGAVAALLILGTSSLASAQSGGDNVLKFDTMVGVPQAFTGAQNPIRGINGGGVPWTLTSGKGELTSDGHLKIKVRGLVIATGPNTGNNPSAVFRGLVSCLAADASVVNILTGPFPATTGPATSGGGNAEIETDVALPSTCIAPIVFVTSNGGSWFASTGR